MNKNQIDHDRLFKELLETFFAEFMVLIIRRRYWWNWYGRFVNSGWTVSGLLKYSTSRTFSRNAFHKPTQSPGVASPFFYTRTVDKRIQAVVGTALPAPLLLSVACALPIPVLP